VAAKTSLLNPVQTRLAGLNDQLCYFLFATEEIDHRLSDFSSALNDCYTSDLFAKNSNAKRINVTLQKLPDFKNNNEKLTFGSYFSTSYEVVVGYIFNLLDLLSDISPNTFVKSISTRNSPEQNLVNSLFSSQFQPIPNELIDTLTYMRLRRNHLTHLNTDIRPNFVNLIQQQGATLNTYWGTSIQELDFSSRDIYNFTVNETIELLKVLRLTLEKIDTCVAASINTNDIIKFILKNFFPNNPNNKQVRARKVRQFAEINFGLQEQISAIVSII